MCRRWDGGGDVPSRARGARWMEIEFMPARHWDIVGRIVDGVIIFVTRGLSGLLVVDVELASASRRKSYCSGQ